MIATVLGSGPRTVSPISFAFAVLALMLVPSAGAQSPAAAPPQGSDSSQVTASAQQSSSSAASVEPKMQVQSAPPADSLGEAARKAKAQKTKSAAKVYTDDSIPTTPDHSISVVGQSGQNANGNSGVPATNLSSGGAGSQSKTANEEAYWRGRAQAIRNQMAAVDQRIARVQDEIANKGAVTVDPSSAQGVILVEDRTAQIKELEAQKASFQNDLDNLTEEGRKAGADSGWFR